METSVQEQSSQPVSRPPDISRALEHLKVGVESLAGKVDALCARLSKVMRADALQQPPTADVPCEDTPCDLAVEINSAARAVANAGAKLGLISTGIEL